MNTLIRSAVLGLAGVALMVGTSLANAQTTRTTTFQATASVNANCLVSAADLAFGAYDPGAVADKDVDTAISVRCTNGTTFTVALNEGATPGATLLQRLMTNGTDFMNYNLYNTPARSTILGDGSNGTVTVSDTGAGLGVPQAKTVNVYGRIPAGQSLLSPGSYTEPMITVTVTF